MARYDRDRDGRLKYSEFCDSFLPIDPFHASLLAKKAPMHFINMILYHLASSITRKDLLYSPETKEILIKCWRMHFENEREAERIRN